MALSCGRRKQRGEKGRHFHVHYHLPRRVSTFSPLRLLPRFSLLSCVLIPLVLFFSVLALVVLFAWFTLLYFVAFLLGKDSNHESFKNDDMGRGSDVDEHRGDGDVQEAKAEAKAVNHAAEVTGNSAAAEVCVRRLDIQKVVVDGLCEETREISTVAPSYACLNSEVRASDDKLEGEVIIFNGSSESLQMSGDSAWNMPETASSDACLDHQLHSYDDKLEEEVIILETKSDKLNVNADLDGFSERHLLQDAPVDRFVEEINIRQVSTSGNSFPILLSTSPGEVRDFHDMNEVAELPVAFLVGNKQNMVVQSNTSAHHNVGDKDEAYGQEFFDDWTERWFCG